MRLCPKGGSTGEKTVPPAARRLVAAAAALANNARQQVGLFDRHWFLLRLHLRQIDALDDALAEIDAEVDRFPTARHLISRAGLAPGSDESVGKRRSNRLRQRRARLRLCGHANCTRGGLCFAEADAACQGQGAARCRRSTVEPPCGCAR
jgi:hypothetical protein